MMLAERLLCHTKARIITAKLFFSYTVENVIK